MIYPTMNKSKSLCKYLSFCGGINKAVEPNAILDNQITQGKNVVCKNDIVRSRKGIYPNLQTVIGEYDNVGSMKKDLTVTETEIFKNGKKHKIGYTVWGNASYENIKTYLVSPTGELTLLATISLTPSEGNFYKTDNIFFLVGKKTFSNSIYAFVKRSCFYNESNHFLYEIYEHDTDTAVFTKLTPSDYYTPVIYINGRGDGYEDAKKNSTVYTATPACPEELNLLGGRFSAYYTSDGVSSNFKLPVSGLDFNSGVICRIYSDVGGYTEWSVPANQYEITATYRGLNIKLSVDRTSGQFSFWNGNSYYQVPKTKIANGNNICLIATKDIEKYAERIIGSNSVYTFNSAYYIYGNDAFKNEIYASKLETPLYFPETMKTAIGNTTDEVTALKHFDGELLAFKSEGIFKIYSAGESGKLSYISPVGITSDFAKPTRLSSKTVSLSAGATGKNTICQCADNLVWLKNRKVYLYSSSDKINEISKPIEGILETLTDSQITNAFSASFEGLYYIFFGNKALVLNFESSNFGVSRKYTANNQNDKNIAWYYFEFPTVIGYVGSITFENEMFIICKDSNNQINYLSTFYGDKDIIIDSENTSQISDTLDIHFGFSGKSINFESLSPKNIVAVNMQMSGSSVVLVDITGDGFTSNQSVKLKSNNLSVIKILPFFMPIKEMNIAISGKAPFILEKLNIEYKII